MEWKGAPPGSIAHLTANGWFLWVDGRPPVVALSETNLLAETGGASVLTNTLAETPAWRESAAVVTLALGRRPAPRPAEQVLALVGLESVDKLEVRFVGEEPLAHWDVLEAWLRTFEEGAASRWTNAALTYVIDTGLPAIPARLADFVWSSAAEVVLRITDRGHNAGESLELPDRAAAAGDQGLLVRPRLCLTRESADRWEQRGEEYRVACHGAAVSFIRPLPDVEGRLPHVDDIPPGEAVAEFLCSIYEGGRHDLSHCYPFSDILRGLAHGTAAIGECAGDGRVSLDASGRVITPERSVDSIVASQSEQHECAWTPLCRALGAAPLPSRARGETGPPPRWEQFYCATLGALMPRVIDELAEAAQFQDALRTRPTDERFRIGVDEGRANIWTESVPERTGR